MISVTELGNVYDLRGLSTDTKPTETNSNITNGSTFFEMDTGDVYIFNKAGNAWIKL